MDSRKRCLRGRPQCPCLRGCTDITAKQFHKIFELEDTGVALYRYVPLDQDPENTIGEIYVLRTEDDFELEPDQFILSLAKHKINCPRCIKLIEKVENSLSGRHLIKQQDVAGICDHCWRPAATLQRLDQKKERPSAAAALDAIKAQLEQAKGEQEDETKVKKRPGAAKLRDTSKTKAGDEKLSPKIPEKEHKTKGAEKLSQKIPDKENETKLLEKVKPGSGTEKLKNKSKIKAEEERRLAKMPEKAKEQIKEKEVKQRSSANQLREQMALMAQEKLKMKKDEESKKREQEQNKKMAEAAANRAREAELQLKRQVQVEIPPPSLEYHEPDSDEDTPKKGYTVYKALPVSDIIIGEKICKNTGGDKSAQLDTSKKISTKTLRKSGSTRAVKKGPFVDSGKHEKEAFERESSDEKLKKTESGLETDGPKTGNATESEAPTKVSVVSAAKVEKFTRKSSEVSPLQKKKEDGCIHYALSDRTFIEKGWTQLPFEKVVRKMNVYRMRPSKPEFDWFEHHKNRVLEYDTGERLAEVEDSGRGRWYYRNGALAMDYYDAEETNAGQRFVVYSSGALDTRGRPRTVLATFDHAGNGIVFDHAGKTRLKYNQTEGIVLDQKIGPVSRWKWHTLNDPPVLQEVMIDTQLSHKDPIIAKFESGDADEPKQEDEAMLSIELENSVKNKMNKSSQNFKPFQIKIKALKINDHFSLRVLDQASIYLLYRDGSTKLKINIGMLLDHKEIVDTDSADIGEVSIKVERLPACTASISALQQTVANARARDAEDSDRRARLGRLSYIDSVDALRAVISRPLPTALFTCRASETQTTQEKLLKPCSCNLYCKQLS